jgi:N-acetylmuramoyl-L-alanine amidase
MQMHKRIWHYLQEHRTTRFWLVQACLLLTLTTGFFGSRLGPQVFAQSVCSQSDRTYVVVNGDTLEQIAKKYRTTAQSLASHNKITNKNLIYTHEKICIPRGSRKRQKASGAYNPYPYGQCTWWADQRFHELTGLYVPWLHEPSDAWEWSARAREFGWHVSHKPSRGAIVNLQAWVQGAYGLGHVAIVEKVLRNGNVIASNMNWGSNPGQIKDVEFSPGSGVTFISA